MLLLACTHRVRTPPRPVHCLHRNTRRAAQPLHASLPSLLSPDTQPHHTTTCTRRTHLVPTGANLASPLPASISTRYGSAATRSGQSAQQEAAYRADMTASQRSVGAAVVGGSSRLSPAGVCVCVCVCTWGLVCARVQRKLGLSALTPPLLPRTQFVVATLPSQTVQRQAWLPRCPATPRRRLTTMEPLTCCTWTLGTSTAWRPLQVGGVMIQAGLEGVRVGGYGCQPVHSRLEPVDLCACVLSSSTGRGKGPQGHPGSVGWLRSDHRGAHM
jgi:hypothetical protein